MTRRYRWVEGIHGWRRRLRESGWRDIVPSWAELMLGGAAGAIAAEIALRSGSELGLMAGAIVGVALVSAIVELRIDRPRVSDGIVTAVSLVIGIVGAAIGGGCGAALSDASGPFTGAASLLGAVVGYPWIPLAVRDRPRPSARGVVRGALAFAALGGLGVGLFSLSGWLPERICAAGAAAFAGAGIVAAFRVSDRPPPPK